MPVYALDEELWFPPPDAFEDHGIVATGGDLRPERLILAYENGIFPWYNQGEPITWFSPLKRMVMEPGEVKISKSTRNILNRGIFEVRFNTCFREIIYECQHIRRPGQEGTWLNDELRESMIELHKLGYAHSAECFSEGKLVGGLYGLSVKGRIFCGDSMFSKVSNASKIAFIQLAQKLQKEGYLWIDCQVYTDYLASLGAYEIPRSAFLNGLHRGDRPDL